MRHAGEDAQLMLKIHSGDRIAYKRLYIKYYTVVTDFIVTHCSDRNSCEDLAHEVFLRIWQDKGRFRGQSTTKTYIFGITKNILCEHRRQIQRQIVVHSHLVEMSGLSEPGMTRGLRELVDAIKFVKPKLSEKQRQAVELVLCSDISPTEAAKLVGCPVNTFRHRLYDAKKRLLVLIEQHFPSLQLQRRNH